MKRRTLAKAIGYSALGLQVFEDHVLDISLPSAGESQKAFDIKLQKPELLKSLNFLQKNCNAGARKGLK